MLDPTIPPPMTTTSADFAMKIDSKPSACGNIIGVMTRDAVLLLTSAALSAALAIAQPSFTPPPVLRVVQEDVKEGKGAAHEKSEAAFMQGLSSIASIVESQAGLDTPEFAALDAIDSQLFSSRRSLIAIYRSDLSYGADKINLPKTRFFSIETVR